MSHTHTDPHGHTQSARKREIGKATISGIKHKSQDQAFKTSTLVVWLSVCVCVCAAFQHICLPSRLTSLPADLMCVCFKNRPKYWWFISRTFCHN